MRKLPLFNHFFWILAAACISTLSAQQTVSFTVSTDPPGANFTVDGTIYTSVAQFEWPAGSQHIVSFPTQTLTGVIVPANANGTITPQQLTQDKTELYTFGGWKDNTGFLAPSGEPTQVVTANGTVTSLTAELTLSYRVLLNFEINNAEPPACGAPLTDLQPPPTSYPGVVYINNVCYWNSAIMYFPANSTLVLNAFPLPGFVFVSWSSNLGSNDAYLRSYVLNGPIELFPTFEPAKRVRVETKPLGLNVLIDRTQAPTLTVDQGGATCPLGENLPIPVATNDLPLCFGDYDFAPGSIHLIAAPSPEKDINGNVWVFDSWVSTSGQSGNTQNSIYTTDNLTATPDKIVISFDPGVSASFVTVPSGLPLTVDGRSNWPAYNFVWALGSTHQVTAPAQSADSTGRQYTWTGWSNGGGATQTITMNQTTAPAGLRMIATYNELSRLVVQTVPAGQTVQIDGSNCTTPCNVDRANGTQVHITAFTTIPAGTGTRLDFASWSDGGPADHVYTINANLQTVTANYTTFYQLSSSANPGNGVTFAYNPTSPDGYYPANSNVTVTANVLNGFKFIRWTGDLSGTYPAGTLSMVEPHSVLAVLTRVPYIAPAGIVNGAGATPETAVAAGSIAMILGESLAASTVAGPLNPLAQTIGNVTVTMGDRLLPMFSVTPQQITVLLPSDLAAGNYTLQVQSPGEPVVTGNFTVVRDAPGVFMNPANSKPYILALHADGTLVTAAKPAIQGEQITFFGTGFGPYISPIVDGFYPPSPPPATADPVSILVAGQTFQPDWSGAAAGYIGLAEVKLTITKAFPSATEVNLEVQINGQMSNTVVLPLQ